MLAVCWAVSVVAALQNLNNLSLHLPLSLGTKDPQDSWVCTICCLHCCPHHNPWPDRGIVTNFPASSPTHASCSSLLYLHIITNSHSVQTQGAVTLGFLVWIQTVVNWSESRPAGLGEQLNLNKETQCENSLNFCLCHPFCFKHVCIFFGMPILH